MANPLERALDALPAEDRDALRDRWRAERLTAVGTLAAGLAHEIRNPLNSAALQLKVLENRLARSGDSASHLGVVEIVRNELGRIERLVSDFLTFAEPLVLEIAPVRLNEMLAELAALLAAPAEKLGVRLVLELDPALGEVPIDGGRLRQVVTNLVENGIEAMPDGGELWIRSHAPDADGFVRLEVEDAGLGFPKDAPIFDPFYSTKASGTGLGLSIAHRIVSDHGGKIQGSSANGRTCFTLLLPAVRRAP